MAKPASKPSKRAQREAAAAENASDDFSSSDDDLSGGDDMQVGESAAAPPASGHKVQLQKTAAADAPFKAKQRPVIFIGQLPKQFQEKEMRKYFGQFGPLVKVRLARDRRSGASKLHGWVEFAKMPDARIAAETMNNYLLFGKMMKVEVMELPPANLFPANYRESFTEFDWRGAEYKRETAPKPLEEWKALQAVYELERALHLKHLKALGFDYSLDVPASMEKEVPSAKRTREVEPTETLEPKEAKPKEKLAKPKKKAKAKK